VSECAAWGDPEISPVGRDDAPIAGTYFVYIFVSVEMCAISVIYVCCSVLAVILASNAAADTHQSITAVIWCSLDMSVSARGLHCRRLLLHWH